MTACLLGLYLATSPSPNVTGLDAVQPPVVSLFGSETWYRWAREGETTFEGVLQPGATAGGPDSRGRSSPYRLSSTDLQGRLVVHELYMPSKARLLTVYLGKRVRIFGKAVDTTSRGVTYHELWPARVEVLSILPADVPPSHGIHARNNWQPSSALRRGLRHIVIRDGTELAEQLQLRGAGSLDQAATAWMAQRLRVLEIDWKRQMLVNVSAGLTGSEADRLTVTRVEVKGKALTVYYRLTTSAGAARGFGYPAESVLVDRWDGPVYIEPDKTPAEVTPPPKR